MAVANSINKIQYEWTGATEFPFPFKIFTPADIKVWIENTDNGDVTLLQLNSEYTVTGVGGSFDAGGVVTLLAAPAARFVLTILRDIAMVQPTSYRTTETFSAAAHESQLDRLTMMCQQLAEGLGRTIRISPTDNAIGELPPLALRANKYFAFDADGNPVLALSAAGQALTAGSAIFYVGDYSESWPTTRPDGITPLELADSGRGALDIGGGKMRLAMYRHGAGATVQDSWIVLQAVYNGALLIGPAPVTMIEFQESDQDDPAGRWRLVGDDDTFAILRKTAAGDPGTWEAALSVDRATGAVTAASITADLDEVDARIDVLQTQVQQAAPVGTVQAFAGAAAPAGWAFCRGQAVNRTGGYAALFAVIGTTYGAGNGSTTFNLPDLRGEFIRGLDASRGVDTGRVLGSAQADELKSHTHTYFKHNAAGGGSGPATNQGDSTANTGATGGTETRPRNVAMNYLIKY